MLLTGHHLAYGLAADLAESRSYGMAWGRVRASGAAGDRRALEAEVLRRIDLAGQGPSAELVREAIGDALEGRRPRW